MIRGVYIVLAFDTDISKILPLSTMMPIDVQKIHFIQIMKDFPSNHLIGKVFFMNGIAIYELFVFYHLQLLLVF